MKRMVFDGGIELLLESVCTDGENRSARERRTAVAMAQTVFGPDVEIEHTAEGRPFIPGVPAEISVSHSARTVVFAWSYGGASIGVDIEHGRSQLLRVAPRVLSTVEMERFGRSLATLATAWTLKEAAYKAAGLPGVDFRSEIVLPEIAAPGAMIAVRHAGLRIVFCGMVEDEYLAVVEKFF